MIYNLKYDIGSGGICADKRNLTLLITVLEARFACGCKRCTVGGENADIRANVLLGHGERAAWVRRHAWAREPRSPHLCANDGAVCEALPLPAHYCSDHDHQDDAACNDAHHNGEVVVFRPGSVSIIAGVRSGVLGEAIQALERVSGSLGPVEGAHCVCRAFHALRVAFRVRERSQRARFLHFAVNALVACVARLALVATARTERRCFANISEVAALRTLDDALRHASALHSDHSPLATTLDHFSIGNVRLKRTPGCVPGNGAAGEALLVARLADIVAIDQRVGGASLHAAPLDGAEANAFRHAHATYNNAWTLRVASAVEFVAQAGNTLVRPRPKAPKARLAQVAARVAPAFADILILFARRCAATIASRRWDQARANAVFGVWSRALGTGTIVWRWRSQRRVHRCLRTSMFQLDLQA